MVTDRNWTVSHLIEVQRRNLESLACRIRQRQVEHLVEITVIDRPIPANADKTATHHLVQRDSVEVSFQQFPIAFVLAAQLEMRRIACDRHIREAKQLIEHDAEFFPQDIFIVLFELLLGWRSEERRVGKECRSRWSGYQ